MRRCLLAFLLPLVFWGSQAGASSGEAIVRVTADKTTIMPGEPVVLRVAVLAPNWFADPVDISVAAPPNTVLRSLPNSTSNLSERVGGKSYSGVARLFHLFLQQVGLFTVSDIRVRTAYVETPPKGIVPVDITAPPVVFRALPLPSVAGVTPSFSATGVEIEDSLDSGSVQMTVGDSFERTMRLQAEGTLGMMIPPLGFEAPAGLAVYPAQPVVEDVVRDRGVFAGGQRTELVTYVAERAGRYELPEQRLTWWNREADRLEETIVPARMLVVAPAGGVAASVPFAGAAVIWIGAIVILLGLAILLAYLGRGLLRVGVDRLRHAGAQLRVAADRSPWIAFIHLRRAARRGDVRATLARFRHWEQLVSGGQRPKALAAALTDAGRAVYGPDAGSTADRSLTMAIVREARNWRREGYGLRGEGGSTAAPLNPQPSASYRPSSVR